MANTATLDLIQKRISKIAVGEKLDLMRASIIRKVGNVDEDIHVWLLSEIKEIEKHRNPTKLNETVSKLTGTGARTTAIHMFIQTFANVRMTSTVKETGQEKNERATLSEGKSFTVFYAVKKERKELSFFTGRKDGKPVYSAPIAYDRSTEKGMDEYLKLAAAKPWWEFRPEPEARAFDFDAIPTGVVNTLKRVFAAAHEKGSFDIPHIDFVNDLYQLAMKHKLDLSAVSGALGGELPKDTPKELSNVIQFPAPDKNVIEVEKAHPDQNPKRGRGGNATGNRAGK